MRYIVIYTDYHTGERKSFRTDWFNLSENYNSDLDMIVFDNLNNQITFDGTSWQDIEEDHL